MMKLKLNCTSLDNLLGGGIESGSITEIYGEAGSGKTNFCLQATRECAVTGRKVAYIDSEGVSLERLNQICNGYDIKYILDRILFFSPMTLQEQEKMISNAIKIKDIQLIIVDTLNLFYRLFVDAEKDETTHSFTRQVAVLQKAAREKNLYIIVTQQVYTDKNGEIKPFTNREIEHLFKTALKLEKVDIGVREATIMKHRSQPEGKKARFIITQKGLE